MITAADVVNELMTKVCEAADEIHEIMFHRARRLERIDIYEEGIPVEKIAAQESDRAVAVAYGWMIEQLEEMSAKIEEGGKEG